MSKKIKGEDGKVYEVKAKKPFYKKVWFWILVVLVIVIFGAVNSGSSSKSSSSSKSDTTKSVSKATAHKTTASEKGNVVAKKASKSITVEYDKYQISGSKTFIANYTDSSWPSATVTANKVIIYKLSKPYKYDSANDGKFPIQGFARIYYAIKANQDISIYPTQGTYVYSNGEQHEADAGESWDGDISNGATKTGYVTVPIKTLPNVSSITTIRCQFTANPQSDMSSEKDYDFTISLK